MAGGIVATRGTWGKVLEGCEHVPLCRVVKKRQKEGLDGAA